MSRDMIKRLSGDAARLGLLLLTCDGTERLEDLPALIDMAGLSETRNRRGPRTAMHVLILQLKDLGFIELQGRSIGILFEKLLSLERDSLHNPLTGSKFSEG